MERRTFLSAGSASVLALAAEFPSIPGDGAPTESPDVVREYYRRASAAQSVNEFADRIPELAHSVSPLLDVATETPSVFDGALRQQLVGVEVVEENIAAEEIRKISDFFAGSVSEEGVETIAENNAVVAVTLNAEDVIGGVFAREWLVAPENGEWRLVWFDERKSPDAAARKLFRQVKQAETLGALDRPVERFSHSASPLVNVAEYTPWYFGGLRRQELIRTSVVAENIDRSEIVIRIIVTIFGSAISVLQSRAPTQPNCFGAAVKNHNNPYKKFEQRWLMAPEAGEWRLVWF